MNRDILVVTGGSSGIGRACASRATTEGWRVINLDRVPGDDAPDIDFIETDLADPLAIQAAFRRIAGIGPVAGLVNNAGVAIARTLEETEPGDFDEIVDVNLRAPALCAKLAARSMADAGFGRIVNIASRAALGKELRTAYAATKGGLISMTRVWAMELARQGITVNAIGPGPIATDLFRRVNPDDSPRTQQIKDSIPVGRLGTPDDIANAALFLLDRRSGFVTGQVLYVCGGMTLGVAGV
jgi:NAD(P)-dependent dehydrogenase (short-subunit alcohol dehydrogenase family)